MILARRFDEWFLAAFAPHLHGCNLSTNRLPRHDAERFHVWRDVVHVWSHAPLNGLTFYPELRYKGYRVWPMNWHPESEEPLLLCFMDHSEISGGGWPPTEKRMKALMEDGWAWNQREGGERYVHVDDLEKIEGPPPQGAF